MTRSEQLAWVTGEAIIARGVAVADMSDMSPVSPRWETKTDAELASALATAQGLAAHWPIASLRLKALTRAQAILAEMQRRGLEIIA